MVKSDCAKESVCEDCLELETICQECIVDGQISHLPSLRACHYCLQKGMQVVGL